jgi:hypothetical protein
LELKKFIGKTVVSPRTGERFVLEEITAPEICVATVALGPYGYPRHYAYETINGDPFSRGILVFEDASLLEPFKIAYDAYCRTEGAYWENYGYYMRRD